MKPEKNKYRLYNSMYIKIGKHKLARHNGTHLESYLLRRLSRENHLSTKFETSLVTQQKKPDTDRKQNSCGLGTKKGL